MLSEPLLYNVFISLDGHLSPDGSFRVVSSVQSVTLSLDELYAGMRRGTNDLLSKVDLGSGCFQRTVGRGSMCVYLGANHDLKLSRHLNQVITVR